MSISSDFLLQSLLSGTWTSHFWWLSFSSYGWFECKDESDLVKWCITTEIDWTRVYMRERHVWMMWKVETDGSGKIGQQPAKVCVLERINDLLLFILHIFTYFEWLLELLGVCVKNEESTDAVRDVWIWVVQYTSMSSLCTELLMLLICLHTLYLSGISSSQFLL